MKENGNYCHGCYFCGFGSGLVVGVGALVVDGGSFWGHWGGVCTKNQKNGVKKWYSLSFAI